MVAVILAGGKGTRLGLKKIPKPMVQINGIPLLERQILTLKKYGITRFYIMSGYLAPVIKKHFGDGKKLGVKIAHITEPVPLGTAGCLKQLEGLVKERFLVVYGDIIFDMDIKRLIAFDRKKAGIATIVAHPNNHPYDSDLIEISDDGRIIWFYSKLRKKECNLRNLVNSGICILSPEIFECIDKNRNLDLVNDILSRSQPKKYAYVTPEYIMDIGTPERLAKARKDTLSGKIERLNLKHKRRAIFLDRDGVINKFVPDISSANDFELIPDADEAIRKINESEYLAVVITNQPGIAKGYMTEQDLQNMHDKMDTLLGQNGAHIDALYYCPHHPEKGFSGEVPALKINCKCRKPKPGMILKAASDLNIDLPNSWMIGDAYRDVQAGIKAGCRSISLGFMPGSKYYASTLSSAIKFILGHS